LEELRRFPPQSNKTEEVMEYEKELEEYKKTLEEFDQGIYGGEEEEDGLKKKFQLKLTT
jgi:hypothetical protein